MKIGIALPHIGPYASRENIVRVAQAAEGTGFDSLWVLERLLRPTFAFHQMGREMHMSTVYAIAYEPLDTLSYVAAKTERIKLGTSVIDALFHPPVVLSKRFAALDQLSGGRVIAGLGQGANQPEFKTANIPLKRRGAGFEEYIAALRAAWGPDPVSFKGRFYSIAESQIGPKPLQQPIPILLGGHSPEAIARAARLADGYNPSYGAIPTAWQSLQDRIKLYQDAVRAAGRDPSSAQVVIRANLTPGGTTGQPLAGSAEQIKEDLAQLRALGVSHVFWDMNFASTPVDDQINWLAPLRRAAD